VIKFVKFVDFSPFLRHPIGDFLFAVRRFSLLPSTWTREVARFDDDDDDDDYAKLSTAKPHPWLSAAIQ
jgi:hypothetical protein